MFDLKQKLLVLVIGCLLPVGAYAQKQGDKRPPKDPDNKVVVQPKGEKPPPSIKSISSPAIRRTA